MIAIVTSMSATTLLEKKSSNSTEFSVQSFQVADSGAQLALKKINNGLGKAINVSFTCDASGDVLNNLDGGLGKYDLSFYSDSAGTIKITDCSKMVSEISSIKSVGSFRGTIRAVNVAVSAQSLPTLYVTDYSSATGNINILDLTNPLAPSLAGIFTGGTADPYHMVVSGRFAYVATYTQNKIEILDLRNSFVPTKIEEVATVKTTPVGLAIYDKYLYVSYFSEAQIGIYSINENTGALNLELASFPAGTRPYGMAVSGKYLYVANSGDNNIQVFDLSSPTNPVSVALVNTNPSGGPTGLSATGNYLYVANHGLDEVQIMNITTKNNPLPLKAFPVTGSPYGVLAHNNVLYVSRLTAGKVSMFDITSPELINNPIAKGDIPAALNGPLGMAISVGE